MIQKRCRKDVSFCLYLQLSLSFQKQMMSNCHKIFVNERVIKEIYQYIIGNMMSKLRFKLQ